MLLKEALFSVIFIKLIYYTYLDMFLLFNVEIHTMPWYETYSLSMLQMNLLFMAFLTNSSLLMSPSPSSSTASLGTSLIVITLFTPAFNQCFCIFCQN